MKTRDLLTQDLYHTAQDQTLFSLAARHSPVIRFDDREPFLPVAAGYTVFFEDGRSSSMEREIQLNQPDSPPAAMAIEYAIWWDWDIHHLYELEHVWVYLDEHERIVRVEASWHGKYHRMPIQVENGRAVLLSEPGKHAFAPTPDWFHKRAQEYRRSETQSVAAHAHVLVNKMFAGKIRQRVFDQTLVRSFLARQAFEPSWNFTKTFTFSPEWLVPWPILNEWIPRRVNSLLERLENITQSAQYRALRLVSAGVTMTSLKTAAQNGAEALLLSLYLYGDKLCLDKTADAPDISEAAEFCRSEPVPVVCQPADITALDHLAAFANKEEVQGVLTVTSPNPSWLARYRALVPGGITAIQLSRIDHDPIRAAAAIKAQFVQPRWETFPDWREALSSRWIEQVHRAGLGIMSWPVAQAEEFDALQRLGVDIIWQDPFPAR